MKLQVHVNRFELRKGKKGFPWTIHTSKGCIRAKSVDIKAPSRAVCHLERRTNPKCFIVVQGKVKNLGKGKFLLVGENGRASMNGIHLGPSFFEGLVGEAYVSPQPV